VFPEKEDRAPAERSYDPKRMKLPGAREAIDSLHAQGY
jgi:hypothetical protein